MLRLGDPRGYSGPQGPIQSFLWGQSSDQVSRQELAFAPGAEGSGVPNGCRWAVDTSLFLGGAVTQRISFHRYNKCRAGYLRRRLLAPQTGGNGTGHARQPWWLVHCYTWVRFFLIVSVHSFPSPGAWSITVVVSGAAPGRGTAGTDRQRPEAVKG